MSTSVFAATVSTALNYYKAIIRKNYDPQDADEKIKQLRLKRRQLRNADDMALYRVAQNVIKEIEQQIDPANNSPSWHFGIADFLQYLKNTLDEYLVENNKVIHAKQNASRAIVDAIQLISLPSERLDSKNRQKLDKSIQIVAKYGTKDQQDMLRKALNNRIENNANLFDTMLQRFKFYINTSSDSWATV